MKDIKSWLIGILTTGLIATATLFAKIKEDVLKNDQKLKYVAIVMAEQNVRQEKAIIALNENTIKTAETNAKLDLLLERLK
tara:strand:- start:117 stop:359 length:243 start_codon:yes stop_codon:yes gene_type:complete